MKNHLFAILLGCAFLSTAFAQSSTTCSTSGQAGCLEIVALNGKFVPGKHDAFRNKVSWEEEVKRGPAFWKAYHEGKEQAAKGQSFNVIVYSINQTPINASDVSVFRANGRNHAVTKMEVVDVTGKVELPANDKNLGVARVFRITAEGDEAFIASIQMSYATLAKVGYFSVCQIDKKRSVVPNRQDGTNESYGISKETLTWFVQKGHKRLPLVFLSKDES